MTSIIKSHYIHSWSWTTKQSVILGSQVHVNSQTKGLERGWFFLSVTCPVWMWGLQDLCVWDSDAMPVLRFWKKKKISRKSLTVLQSKLVPFFSFRLRSLANVMAGRILIPHQHPVEWTSLSPLLTWQTHAAVAATPLVPTSHTYMTFQKMNLIDCCAW